MTKRWLLDGKITVSSLMFIPVEYIKEMKLNPAPVGATYGYEGSEGAARAFNAYCSSIKDSLQLPTGQAGLFVETWMKAYDWKEADTSFASLMNGFMKETGVTDGTNNDSQAGS